MIILLFFQEPSQSKIPRLNGGNVAVASKCGTGSTSDKTRATVPSTLCTLNHKKFGSKSSVAHQQPVNGAIPKTVSTDIFAKGSNLVQKKIKKSFLSRFSSNATREIFKVTKSNKASRAMVVDKQTDEPLSLLKNPCHSTPVLGRAVRKGSILMGASHECSPILDEDEELLLSSIHSTPNQSSNQMKTSSTFCINENNLLISMKEIDNNTVLLSDNLNDTINLEDEQMEIDDMLVGE